MEIPTEPIDSILRPRELVDALRQHDPRVTEDGALENLYDEAIRAPSRNSRPRVRPSSRTDRFVEHAQRYARLPVKQAVISPSALSLMYPAEGIPGYTRDAFIDDVPHEHVTEVRHGLGAAY